MLPYVRLAPGPDFRAERALLYYAQRLIGLSPMRRAISGVLAATVRQARGCGDPPPLDRPGRRALADLQQCGLAGLLPAASWAQASRMADYFRARPVIAPGGERMRLEALPADVGTAQYDLATIMRCPGLMSLVNAQPILRLAEAYLGCPPTLASLGVRWSFPNPGAQAPHQRFHRDVDDWRFLKLFIYLTDVGPDAGPHAYVRGSHARSFGLRARSYEPAELAARFGAEAVVTITGPRGTTFMADTLGVHRGGRPSAQPRLLLQAQYSILPVFAFRYEPLDGALEGLDAYCNRLLLRTVGRAREIVRPDVATCI